MLFYFYARGDTVHSENCTKETNAILIAYHSWIHLAPLMLELKGQPNRKGSETWHIRNSAFLSSAMFLSASESCSHTQLLTKSDCAVETEIVVLRYQKYPLSYFFCLNPLLFASCTNTFSKWCKITRGMKKSAQ
jgi:hypothetical protein